MQATISGRDELNRVERVARNRSGLWVAIAITVVGLLIFTGLFNFVPNPDWQGAPLILLGLILSLVPAALWLILFYRLDRLDPEPKRMIVDVFVLGVLAAAALHDPLIHGLFGVRAWQNNSWWASLLGGILIVGFIEQALVYFTVRFSVFRSPEFDERVDGVIYAVAVGLGIATVVNFQYVLASEGVDLGIGSIRMVVNALAYASFAGILGYFIGQARFEQTPVYYLPLGVTIAAVINGLFWFLLDRTAGRGLNPNPWGDLVFATIVAIITLGVVFWLIERANEETLRLAHRQLRGDVGYAPPAAPVLAPAVSQEPAAAAAPISESEPAAPPSSPATDDTGESSKPANEENA